MLKLAKIKSATNTFSEFVGFDVFDTVLMRKTGSPDAVFVISGRQLLQRGVISISPEQFADARVAADLQSRRKLRGAEVTIDEIYDELTVSLQLSDKQRDLAQALELSLEDDLLTAVSQMAARVSEARSRGAKIVFASDTYLPKQFVESQLRRNDLMRDGDLCYVSCDHRLTKWSGQLYFRILQDQNLKASKFRFCGNNRLADVLAPQRIGIPAEHFSDGNLNRFERLMEGQRKSVGVLTSALSGASRLTRLSVSAGSPLHASLRDVACGVIAPTLVGFALWLLRRCQETGTQRLYFLSRDGYLLRLVTMKLARKLRMPIETRYLFSSRRAWLPSCLTQVDRRQILWAFENSRFLSVTSLLSRLGITPLDVSGSLNELGFEEKDWNKNLRANDRLALRNAILHDNRIKDCILRRGAESRKVLVNYLMGEGLFDGNSWAFVDLGWHASTQVGLQRLIRCNEELQTGLSSGGNVGRGFYFGLRCSDAQQSCQNIQAEGYFFDECKQSGYVNNELPQVGMIMETFCSSGHKRLEALRADGSGVELIFGQKDINKEQKEMYRTILRTVLRFAEVFHSEQKDIDLNTDIRGTIHELIRLFWNEPTKREALAWGKFPVDDRLGAQLESCLAAPYTWWSVGRAFRSGVIDLPPGCVWFNGCFKQTNPVVRTSLRSAVRLAKIRQQIFGKGRAMS